VYETPVGVLKKPPAEMSKLDIIDKAETFLMTQGSRALRTEKNGTMGCVYRTDDNQACAVGAFLPNDDVPVLEFIGSVNALCMGFEHVKMYLGHEVPDEDFWGELQDVHDKFTPDEWPDQFARLKNKYK
jgi:hypothetical protein